jgi:hypothetical protein
VLIPDRSHFPTGTCRFAAASPCTPPVTSHQQRFTRCGRPDGAAALGFAPCRPEADEARQGGHRPSSTDMDYALNSHRSIDNPVVLSLSATSGRTLPSTRPEPASPHASHVAIAIASRSARFRRMRSSASKRAFRGDVASDRTRHSGEHPSCESASCWPTAGRKSTRPAPSGPRSARSSSTAGGSGRQRRNTALRRGYRRQLRKSQALVLVARGEADYSAGPASVLPDTGRRRRCYERLLRPEAAEPSCSTAPKGHPRVGVRLFPHRQG